MKRCSDPELQIAEEVKREIEEQQNKDPLAIICRFMMTIVIAKNTILGLILIGADVATAIVGGIAAGLFYRFKGEKPLE